jgi:hypothetical protein
MRMSLKMRKFTKKQSDRIADRIDELSGVKAKNELVATLLAKDSDGNYIHSLDSFLSQSQGDEVITNFKNFDNAIVF